MFNLNNTSPLIMCVSLEKNEHIHFDKKKTQREGVGKVSSMTLLYLSKILFSISTLSLLDLSNDLPWAISLIVTSPPISSHLLISLPLHLHITIHLLYSSHKYPCTLPPLDYKITSSLSTFLSYSPFFAITLLS